MCISCRFDHDIKGQGIYAFVTLHEGHDFSEEIRKDLVKTVREQIGAFAAPDVIHWAPGLPASLVLTHSVAILPASIGACILMCKQSCQTVFQLVLPSGWRQSMDHQICLLR